jgi:hypothetical protein
VIRWRSGTVVEIVGGWRAAVELSVRVASSVVPALAYPALVGSPEPGDRVLLNVTALDLRLGTGGYAFVVALPDRLPPDPPLASGLVKARYSPLQVVVPSAPALGSTLDGMPVVTADLHSAVPAILCGLGSLRAAYVMTDGGALPAAFSRSLAALSVPVVTAGHSYGGDLEAVNVHSGLLLARHNLGADVAIVAPGPGSAGTGTEWGFSGTAVGEAVNAAYVLGGQPVGALRLSFADSRSRHQGVSHHSLTAYGRVALAPCDIAVPAGLTLDLSSLSRHRVVEVDVTDLAPALRALSTESMGRTYDDDPWYFLANAAAGRHAGRLADLGRYGSL